jgi:TP901 family phage tail tape measure protein
VTSLAASIKLSLINAFSSPLNAAKNDLSSFKQNLNSMKTAGADWSQLGMELTIQANGFKQLSSGIQNMIDQPSQLAAGLDSAFKNIQTVTGKTNTEMKLLRSEIIAVGGKSTARLQASANAFYDIAGGVADASTHLSILKSSLALSEAGQANLEATTKGLISVMNSYKLSANQTAFASDVLTRTVGMGVGSMDEFVSAIGPLAGLTASVKIPFNDLGTAMAFMTTQGTSASMSANRIQASIVSLMKPNKDMTDAIKASGYATGTQMIQQLGLVGALNQLNAVMDGNQDKMAGALGSVEALQAMVSLTKDGFSNFSKTFQTGLNGITQSSQKVQLESYNAKLALLTAAKERFSEKVGTATNAIRGFGAGLMTWVLNGLNAVSDAPALGWIPGFVAGLGTATSSALGFVGAGLNVTAQVATIANVASKGKDIAGMFGSVASLVSTPFKMLGGGILKLIPVIWSFSASLLACPITWIVLGVIALAGCVYLLIKNWKAVSTFFVNLWNGIVGIFKKAWDFIWNGLLNNKFIQIALAVFFPFIGLPILIIKNWGKIMDFFKAIPGFFVGLWNGIVSIFMKAWNFIWNGLLNNKYIQIALTVFAPFIGIPILIMKNFGVIKTFFIGLWDGIVGIFQSGINFIKGLINEIVNMALFIPNLISSLFNAGKKVPQTMAKGVKQDNSLADAMLYNFQTTKPYIPQSDAKKGPFSQLTLAGRKIISTMSMGVTNEAPVLDEAVKKSFNVLDNPSVIGGLKANDQTGGKGDIHIHIGNIEYIAKEVKDIKSLKDFVDILAGICGVTIA